MCLVLQAVREAVSIPVIANGNIRNLQDVHDCIAYTGVEGVMSAESLLEDPALFWPQRLQPGGGCVLSSSTCLTLLMTRYYFGRLSRLSVCLCQSVCLSVSLSGWLVRPYVCLSVCLSVCLWVSLILFICLCVVPVWVVSALSRLCPW